MLGPEEREILGLAPELCVARRPSAVSQVLRAIREDAENGPATWAIEQEPATGSRDGFRILVAAGRATRQRASNLAQHVYQACGYLGTDEDGLCVTSSDAEARTLTLLVEDEAGRDVGTVSLMYDAPHGLPCDEVFRAELVPLRAQGRRLVEVTRLAIAPRYTHSKTLLVHLFNFISVFSRRVEPATDFIIEVNPRHVAFYVRMLLFQVQGPECPCPRVNGAPAVLLRLDLSAQAEELRHVGGTRGRGRGPHGKTLYAYFHSCADEHLIAAFLAACYRPMTPEEMRFFHLDQKKILTATQVA